MSTNNKSKTLDAGLLRFDHGYWKSIYTGNGGYLPSAAGGDISPYGVHKKDDVDGLFYGTPEERARRKQVRDKFYADRQEVQQAYK